MEYQKEKDAGVMTAPLADLSRSQDRLNAFHTNTHPEPWRTVRIGGLPKQELFARIPRVAINADTRRFLAGDAFRPALAGQEVRLAKRSVRSFGFQKPPQTQDLWYRVGDIGERCLPDVAFALAEEAHSAQKGIWWLYMHPLTSGGIPFVLALQIFGGGVELSLGVAGLRDRWMLESEIVFAVP